MALQGRSQNQKEKQDREFHREKNSWKVTPLLGQHWGSREGSGRKQPRLLEFLPMGQIKREMHLEIELQPRPSHKQDHQPCWDGAQWDPAEHEIWCWRRTAGATGTWALVHPGRLLRIHHPGTLRSSSREQGQGLPWMGLWTRQTRTRKVTPMEWRVLASVNRTTWLRSWKDWSEHPQLMPGIARHCWWRDLHIDIAGP